MLWSLVKFLLFVAIVAALTFGAHYLLTSPNLMKVNAEFNGFEVSMGPLTTVLVAVAILVAVWVVLKVLSLLIAILKFLAGDETALSRWAGRNRERKGYRALAEALTSLASGEPKLAMAKAKRAERYLERPDLTNLLLAQAAEMGGDADKATETYKKLIQDEKTRFVGIRGILKQKLAAGESETAMKLAEQAFKLRPKNEEMQDTLLQLQAQAHDWAGARQTLSAKMRSGHLPRDVYTRREAVLALSEAQDILAADATTEEREEAIRANQKSPDLIPAAAMAARAYIKKGKVRNAKRILTEAWKAQPHPDLAAVFAEIEPNETPSDRVTRFKTLFDANPDNPDTKIISAELHVAAEDFPGARRALGDLAETLPDARVMTLMAAIERGQGSEDAVVRGWMARALTAQRGPQWVCSNCQAVNAEWAPVCSNCDAFDTLAWTTPPASDASLGAGSQMLPLIVGALGDQAKEETPDLKPEDADVVVEATGTPEPARP